MAPSRARILSMIHPVLVGHYNLIRLKKSTLPSTQRKLVVKRVEFNVSKGKILQAYVDDSYAILKEENEK